MANAPQVRNVTDIVTTIRNLGFNCIRLVFSLELIYTDPPVLDRALAANPGKLLTIYDEAHEGAILVTHFFW